MAPCLRPCTVPTRPDRPVVSVFPIQQVLPGAQSPFSSQFPASASASPPPPPPPPSPTASASAPARRLHQTLPLRTSRPAARCDACPAPNPPPRCCPLPACRHGPLRVLPCRRRGWRGWLPLPIVGAEGALAVLDGAIATAAFVQLARIHRHNQLQGWTRQKIFHLMIGLSNIVFLVYFVSTIIATCQRWICWVHGCGFVLMASPQILLLASFLLLLSFWVDLCHQTNDEDEEDGRSQSHHEALLDRTKAKPGIRPVNIRQRCCPGIQLGSRQKFVILVLVLSFVVMFTFAILIWIGRGENPIDSSLLKRVYLDVFSIVVIVLGGALACYGAVLFSKMSKVRSETVSTEKWKVASLAAVSLICFSSSAILALVTNVPVLLYWYSTDVDIINNAVILFIYYFIGSSVPSGFVLWIMREMPHRQVVERPTESTVVTLFRERPSTTQDPQWRTAVTSSNKALKSSPI